MIASASYTLAAARNLRKHTSEPWMSVAKKIRSARFFVRPLIPLSTFLLRRELAHGHGQVQRVAGAPHVARDRVDNWPGTEHDHQGRDRLDAELAVDAGVRHQLEHREQRQQR